jgi:hypothetical protein
MRFFKKTCRVREYNIEKIRKIKKLFTFSFKKTIFIKLNFNIFLN